MRMSNMKKTLLLAALAIAAFAGCNKEETPVTQIVTLTCGFAGDQPLTRVSFDKANLAGTAATLQPKWDEGDAIAVVLDDNSLVKFTLGSGAGTNNATFDGTVPDGRTISKALYPWIDEKTNPDEWIMGLYENFIFGHQTYDADRIFDKDFNAYYGAVSGSNISFTGLNDEILLQGEALNMGYILFRLKGTAKISGILYHINDGGISLHCSDPVQLDPDSETLFGMVFPMLYTGFNDGSLTFGFFDENDNNILDKSIHVGTVGPHTLLDLPPLTVNAPKSGATDGHDWVEIGGVKWATMNLGATTVAGSPSTCYGDYYAWGETEPRYTSITITGANSASIVGWKSGHTSGYSSSDMPSYTGSTLDADHDAATQNWGSAWRTPTNAEFKALAKECTGSESNQITPSSLTTSSPDGGIYWLASNQDYLPEYNGVAGVLFVDKSDSSLRIFFPAAGYCSSTSFFQGGSHCDCWSSSIFSSNASYARTMWITSGAVTPSHFNERRFGLTVRPVKD